MKIRNFQGFSLQKRKKSHTCEKGGAHFTISSWHLLMNFKKPEKMKKTPGDMILLHKCIINDNHMIYGSWDSKCNRLNFFVIWGHFLAFYLPNSLKNRNIKKKKKKTNIISFHTSVPKFMIIAYTFSEICHVTDVIIFHFGLHFSLLPPNSPKNEKLKTKKKHLEISSVNKNVPKIMIICFTVPQVWHVTDGIVAFNLGLFFVLLPL